MTIARAPESGHFHAVKFYKDTESLAEIVCAFIAEGLQRGEPAVIIATAEHRGFFKECLTGKDIDVDAALAAGSLTLLDAEETLERFMRDGVPMSQPFADTLTPILGSIAARFPGLNIRAYG